MPSNQRDGNSLLKVTRGKRRGGKFRGVKLSHKGGWHVFLVSPIRDSRIEEGRLPVEKRLEAATVKEGLAGHSGGAGGRSGEQESSHLRQESLGHHSESHIELGKCEGGEKGRGS